MYIYNGAKNNCRRIKNYFVYNPATSDALLYIDIIVDKK